MRNRLRLVALVFTCTAVVAVSVSAQQQTAWRGAVAVAGEKGERMFVSGRVIDKATSNPVSGAEVYLYQTDDKGIYGDSPRTPRLKATLYTRSDGHYEFTSIRPGPYPNEKILAHVHYVVYADGFKEWQGELIFEDDPLLTPERRATVESDPTYLLRPIARDAKGVWQVTADVTLVK